MRNLRSANYTNKIASALFFKMAEEKKNLSSTKCRTPLVKALQQGKLGLDSINSMNRISRN